MQYSFNNHPERPRLDTTAPNLVQVQVDSQRRILWVNVDGFCALRIWNTEEPITVVEQ